MVKLTECELAGRYREKSPGQKMSRAQENYIAHLMNRLGWDIEEREEYWRERGISSLALSKKQASEVIKDLQEKLYQRG